MLTYRIARHRPWHGPPTRFGDGRFHLSAACYEHLSHIGKSLERLGTFSQRLLEMVTATQAQVFALCVLPNHYHLLIETGDIPRLKREIGRLHGRTSRQWNEEERVAGRKVWHRCADRAIRSDRHFWATVNYIHHNPVHHGYVRNWIDWPFSSARDFIDQAGRERVLELWKEYPVRDYGKGWDDPDL